MTGQKLTDAMVSNDADTKNWKLRFSAAKAAYDMNEFRKCESLLYRLLEQAKTLKEEKFATNTCRVGLGAVHIATGKIDQAQEELQHAVETLSASADDALKELCAVARRFYAKALTEAGNDDGAEDQLRSAITALEEVGEECVVQLAYALSDMAGLYIAKGKLSEAKELIFSAMKVLERQLGSEDPEYIRANLIYNICDSRHDEELLSELEEGLFSMQYQLGKKHPSLTRAVRWYLKKRQERGETDKVDEMMERFGLCGKALGV